MCVLMVLAFLVAWCPYAFFAGYIFLNKGMAFTAISMAVPAFFAKSSAVVNPVIYILLNKQVSSFTDWFAFTYRPDVINFGNSDSVKDK